MNGILHITYGEVSSDISCSNCVSGPFRDMNEVSCKHCRISQNYVPTMWSSKEEDNEES